MTRGACGEGKDLQILYRDEHLAAVHKPAGLLVHRTNLDRHATTSALQQTRNRLGQHVFPVHRLDRPTSGVLLFALSPEVARAVAADFAAHRVEKRYLAVVRGYTDGEGSIDYPLVEESELPCENTGATGAARDAVTRYRRLASVEVPFSVGRYERSRYSLVEMLPITGRRHQLRRHFKHLLHPIIGDTKYGEGRHNRLFRSEFACDRLLLAAMELVLDHPVTGDPLSIRAPLEGEFLEVVKRFEWEGALPPPWIA